MRYFLFLLLFVAMLSGCGTSGKQETPSAPPKVLVPEFDTFFLGDMLVSVEKTDSLSFSKLPVQTVEMEEADLLLKDSAKVKRRGDTLIFKTKTRRASLINRKTDDDSHAEFYYCGYMPDMDQFLVYGVYYEFYDYLLISGRAGDTTVTIGKPVIAPGKKHFICGNVDLAAAFTFNGIEYYTNAATPVKIASRELWKWGPSEIRWMNDTVLLARAEVRDTGQETLTRTEYFKLTLQKKK